MAGIDKNCQEFSSLEERLGMFFDNHSPNHDLTIDILGVTTPGDMILEGGEPLAEEPDSFVDDGFPFPCEPFDTIKIPELSCSTKTAVSSSFSTPDSSLYVYDKKKHTTNVVVKDGHFNSPVYVPGKLVEEWTFSSNLNEKSLRSLIIQAHDNTSDAPTTGHIQLIESSGISVISDIDDTIKDSGVFRGKKHLLLATFLHECREVPGMSEVYQKWADQGASFHYVSNSPWQLFPMLDTFFDKFSFPSGSAHLKLFDLNHKALFYEPQGAKRASIIQLLKDFPDRKFIMVGDSGEMDLELYTSLARDYSKQILKIFIRDVTTNNLDVSSPYGSLSDLQKFSRSNSTHSISRSSFSSTKSSKFSWTESGRWKSLKSLCSRGSCPRDHSNLSGSSGSQMPSPTDSGESSPPSDSVATDEELWTEPVPPAQDSTPTQAQMAIRAKFQQRVAQATRGLSSSIVTIFTSPSSLRDCPIVQSHLSSKNLSSHNSD